MARFGGWGMAAATVVALTGVMWVQADTVQGTVTVGAAKVVVNSGMAVSYTAPNGRLVSVLLSDKPADRKAFAADTKTGPGEPLMSGLFEGAWKSQHIGGKLSGLTFTFGAEAKLIGEEFLVGGKNNTFSLGARVRARSEVDVAAAGGPYPDADADRGHGLDEGWSRRDVRSCGRAATVAVGDVTVSRASPLWFWRSVWSG